mgnify:CR=1 FL=1
MARDAAHKRMIEALERGENLPIDIKDSTIYYMGPSPAREGRPIGSAGPTTATRMDKYAPTLLDLGEKAMIGKGKRSKEVMDAIVRIMQFTLRQSAEQEHFYPNVSQNQKSYVTKILELRQSVSLK